MEGIITAWGKILRGYRPSLSIEITRECPLRCPGCYAYGDEHLGGDVNLRQVTDYKGQELIDRVLGIVDAENPIHVSIVGGEPLVRYKELNEILPKLAERGVYSQVVTSAVRPIPIEWAKIPRLQMVVSIDGLQPEHDVRRTPATYDRIHKHIVGQSPEILTPHDRERVIAALMALRAKYTKIAMPEGLVKQCGTPPDTPDECIFAQTTSCISADFEHRITPCQFGGNPDCSQCGCIASAGLKAVGAHRLPGGIRVGAIFETSFKIGRAMRNRREEVA